MVSFISVKIYLVKQSATNYIDKLNAVTKDDVVGVAKKITQDTVYFLTSLSGEGERREEK